MAPVKSVSKSKIAEIAAAAIKGYKGLKSESPFQSRVNAAIQLLFTFQPIRNAVMAISPPSDFQIAATQGLHLKSDDPTPLKVVNPNLSAPLPHNTAIRYKVLMALQNCFFSLHPATKSLACQELLTGVYEMEEFVEDFEDIIQYFFAIYTDILMRIDGNFNVMVNLAQIREKSITYTSGDNPICLEKNSSFYFFRFKLGSPHIRNIYESFADRASRKAKKNNAKFFDSTESSSALSKVSVALPPILFIRLDRCEEEPMPISERCPPSIRQGVYEFYEEIDLTKYVGERPKDEGKGDGANANTAQAAEFYTLVAVVGQKRDSVTSHPVYPVFIRNGQNWVKLQDEKVEYCSKAEVIEGNYGIRAVGSVANTLVYVRSNKLATCEQNMDKDEIPKRVMKKVKTSRQLAVYKSCLLLTEDTFRDNNGLNLFKETECVSGVPLVIPHSHIIEVKVGIGLARFYEIVAEVLKWEPKSMRIWLLDECSTRDKVIRPLLLTEVVLRSKCFRDTIHVEQLLFVEKYTYDSIPSFNIDYDCLLFLKEFDGEKLQYLGLVYVPWKITIGNLLNEIFGKNGLQLTENSGFRVYLEIGGNEDRNDLVKEITTDDVSKSLSNVVAIDESMGEILIIDWTKESTEFGLLTDPYFPNHGPDCTCFFKAVNAAKYVRLLKYKKPIEFTHYSPPYESHTIEISIRTLCVCLPNILEEQLGIATKDIRLFECRKYGRDPGRVIHYDREHKLEKLKTFLPTDAECETGADRKIFYLLKPKSLDDPKQDVLKPDESGGGAGDAPDSTKCETTEEEKLQNLSKETTKN